MLANRSTSALLTPARPPIVLATSLSLSLLYGFCHRKVEFVGFTRQDVATVNPSLQRFYGTPSRRFPACQMRSLRELCALVVWLCVCIADDADSGPEPYIGFVFPVDRQARFAACPWLHYGTEDSLCRVEAGVSRVLSDCVRGASI